MEHRLSRFGIGPKIAVSATVCLALAAAATHFWPDVCVVRAAPYGVCVALGALLVLLGVPMWLIAVVSVMRAYNSDRLVTSGVFGLCRHPVYGAWIVLILPGIALITRSWVFLIPPIVACAVFKALIRTEDEYLDKRFGPAYVEYRATVNEIVPFPIKRSAKR